MGFDPAQPDRVGHQATVLGLAGLPIKERFAGILCIDGTGSLARSKSVRVRIAGVSVLQSRATWMVQYDAVVVTEQLE